MKESSAGLRAAPRLRIVLSGSAPHHEAARRFIKAHSTQEWEALERTIQKMGKALKTFEVTASGYDGSTDATDDRVFWVKAQSHDVVRAAIAGTKAVFHGSIDAETDIDFVLPAQDDLLKAKLMEFANLVAHSVSSLNEAMNDGGVTVIRSTRNNVVYPGALPRKVPMDEFREWLP